MTREEFDKALALYDRLDEIKRKQENLEKANKSEGVRWGLHIDSFDCLENLGWVLNEDEVKIITSILTQYYKAMAASCESQIEEL